jgi:hypothetical protein
MAFFEEARERDQSRQLPRRLAAGMTLENAKQDRSGKKSKGRLRAVSMSSARLVRIHKTRDSVDYGP